MLHQAVASSLREHGDSSRMALRDSLDSPENNSLSARLSVRRPRCPPNPSFQKLDRLFIDRQDGASGVAAHLMPRSRRIDDKGSLRVNPTLVPLRSSQNQNVLVSDMFVQRHLAMLAVSKQSSRRPCHPFSVKPEDIDPLFVRLPRDLILLCGKKKNVFEFELRRSEGRL
jgi:hypothetical protein